MAIGRSEIEYVLVVVEILLTKADPLP